MRNFSGFSGRWGREHMDELIADFAGTVAGMFADFVAGGGVAGGDDWVGKMAGGERCRFCREFDFDCGGGRGWRCGERRCR